MNGSILHSMSPLELRNVESSRMERCWGNESYLKSRWLAGRLILSELAVVVQQHQGRVHGLPPSLLIGQTDLSEHSFHTQFTHT